MGVRAGAGAGAEAGAVVGRTGWIVGLILDEPARDEEDEIEGTTLDKVDPGGQGMAGTVVLGWRGCLTRFGARFGRGAKKPRKVDCAVRLLFTDMPMLAVTPARPAHLSSAVFASKRVSCRSCLCPNASCPSCPSFPSSSSSCSSSSGFLIRGDLSRFHFLKVEVEVGDDGSGVFRPDPEFVPCPGDDERSDKPGTPREGEDE
jgi:hypothetical protein